MADPRSPARVYHTRLPSLKVHVLALKHIENKQINKWIWRWVQWLAFKHVENKQINMASSAVICVYVLEGQYAQLSTLGFPASLLLELQECGLRLNNAKWSSRHSDAGFQSHSSGQQPWHLDAGKGEGSQNLS